MIDVDEKQLGIVKHILMQFVPDCEVKAFGSRVNGNPKLYSDLDLAVVGKEKLSIRTMGELREAFQESDLPFRVDVLDWNSISDSFKAVINQNYVLID